MVKCESHWNRQQIWLPYLYSLLNCRENNLISHCWDLPPSNCCYFLSRRFLAWHNFATIFRHSEYDRKYGRSLLLYRDIFGALCKMRQMKRIFRRAEIPRSQLISLTNIFRSLFQLRAGILVQIEKWQSYFLWKRFQTRLSRIRSIIPEWQQMLQCYVYNLAKNTLEYQAWSWTRSWAFFRRMEPGSKYAGNELGARLVSDTKQTRLNMLNFTSWSKQAVAAGTNISLAIVSFPLVLVLLLMKELNFCEGLGWPLVVCIEKSST